ncbi:hypothetical protein Vretimale_13797, partial [Volvox reticuliferus]
PVSWLLDGSRSFPLRPMSSRSCTGDGILWSPSLSAVRPPASASLPPAPRATSPVTSASSSSTPRRSRLRSLSFFSFFSRLWCFDFFSLPSLRPLTAAVESLSRPRLSRLRSRLLLRFR